MATKKSTATPAKKATKTVTKPEVKAAPKAEAKAPSKKAVTPASPAKPAASKAAEKRDPTHAEISHLAHQYWKERGHDHGSHDDDWTRAEKELKSRS